jgi:hypothetical protein
MGKSEIDCYEDQDVDGSIILIWILEKQWGMDWLQALISMVMNFQIWQILE